jgi:hypothetical protein
MKSIVALLWILDTFHQALLIMAIYHYTVTNWGDVAVLGITTWTLEIQIMVGNIITSIVQCFFAFRIWRLSEKNWVLTGAIVILSVCQLGLGTAVCFVTGFHGGSTQNTVQKKEKLGTGTALSSDIACDLVITVSMVYYLHKNRTGFKRTDTMIDMLVTYSIRTCLLITVCTLSSLITFFVFPNEIIYGAFYFVACRLYVGSFLSTLNAREHISNVGQGSDMPVISLSRFAGSDPYGANDGHVKVVIGSDKFPPTEAHSQPHKE